MGIRAPRYTGLMPASTKASAAARGASRKSNTKPEIALRRALWRAGLRFRRNVTGLPGEPDVVFKGARVIVFCDGNFWHGKDWETRKQKLLRGSNPSYWIAKIERNMQRDRQNVETLENRAWTVLRFWESEILTDVESVVAMVAQAVYSRNSRRVGRDGGIGSSIA